MKMYSLPILLTLFISINVQAQSNNTDVKIKKLNIVNVGVRESSAPLSYMVGSNAYSGYHVELCERILK